MRLVWIDASGSCLSLKRSYVYTSDSTNMFCRKCMAADEVERGISDRSIGSHPEGKVAGVDRIVIQEVQGGVTALKRSEFSSLEPEQASRALVGMILVGS